MFDKVVDLICQQLPVNKADVKMESRLLEDLGADSANLMILVMDMESEFDLVVGDIVNYLEEHKG